MVLIPSIGVGCINRQAAYFGCTIFAEHTTAAHEDASSHGNIQRLLKVIASGEALVGIIEEK
jgi:hypothetical protein